MVERVRSHSRAAPFATSQVLCSATDEKEERAIGAGLEMALKIVETHDMLFEDLEFQTK
jgi:hypothetical protein